MKKRFSFVLAMFMMMLALTGAVLASPTLQAETGSLSAEIEGGEVDLNISELFVVKRGYAIPFAEKELPAEYRNYEKIDYDMWHVNLYLVDTDEFVEAPVLAGEGCAELVVNDTLSDVYNRQYCKYTLYTSGIIVLEPVTTNTDASVLDSDDETALYSATLDRNVKFNKVEGLENTYALENANINKNVVIDENTLIYAWLYTENQKTYELHILDKDVFASLPEGEYANINYVVKNNPDPDEADTLLYMISYKLVTAVENLRIVSLSTPGKDENGKYRNYYELFNPCTGIKVDNVVGSTMADSVASLPAALESGLVVTVKDGVIDEAQAPVGKINPADTSKGIVWISGYDAERNTITVVPTYVTENACCKTGYTDALNGYVFDAENPDVNFDGKQYDVTSDGKIEYKLTSNTVVSILECFDLNALTKWGAMKLGNVAYLTSGKQYYKCYNDKFVDDSGNLKKKVALNVMAYVYGNDSIADMIIVIVGELPENQNGMFNKKDDCETHKTPRTIEQIRVFIAENDNLDDIPADNINIEMKVKNINHANDALFLLCTYDVNGVLLNTYCKVSEAGIGEYDTLTQAVDNTEGKIAFIKAFVFDTVSVLSPVAESVTK